ncbi:MAG: formate dehydrogenase accessory sulfurtransferase FdhD [Syntrophomonadaceae bacterium]|jgi:FdhD protein
MTELTWTKIISQFKTGTWQEFADTIVQEMPVTVYLNDREIATMLCTPEYLEELALGFLASEGFIVDKNEIKDIRTDYLRGMVYVYSTKDNLIAQNSFMKRLITSGCGKGSSFFNVMDAMQLRPVQGDIIVSSSTIISLGKKLQNLSSLFRTTGGVHSAGLCRNGEILVCRDDIGRHNAADKVIGRCIIEGITAEDKIFITTGRISSEILIKVAKIGIPILVSRSAPTALAVKLAEKVKVTIVGFVRGNRFNVYSEPHRVTT